MKLKREFLTPELWMGKIRQPCPAKRFDPLAGRTQVRTKAMRAIKSLVLVVVIGIPGWQETPAAQLEIEPVSTNPAVICGAGRILQFHLRNPSEQEMEIELSFQLYQASSSTATPAGPKTKWKMVQLSPRQTTLETVLLDVPSVKAETHWILRWLDDNDSVLGATKLRVYPTNLLEALKPLAGEQPLGLFDPHNRLSPLLHFPGLEIEELADSGIRNFTGKLAIIGPYTSEDRLPENLAETVEMIARNGVAVVWIQPPPQPDSKLQPSFYSINQGTNAVVVVEPELLEDIAVNPRAQLNLVALARLARFPQPVHLPANQ